MDRFILGVKKNQSQLFDETGSRIAVTTIQTTPNYLLDIKLSEKNGYSGTEVYIVSVHRHDDIIQIEPDDMNGRIEINIEGPSYIWVRTILSESNFNQENIQQFDYQNNYWNKDKI